MRNSIISPKQFAAFAKFEYGESPNHSDVITKKLGRAKGFAGILCALGQTSASAGYNPMSPDDLTEIAAKIEQEISESLILLNDWGRQCEAQPAPRQAGEREFFTETPAKGAE